jgi:hypothetical protein
MMFLRFSEKRVFFRKWYFRGILGGQNRGVKIGGQNRGSENRGILGVYGKP